MKEGREKNTIYAEERPQDVAVPWHQRPPASAALLRPGLASTRREGSAIPKLMGEHMTRNRNEVTTQVHARYGVIADHYRHSDVPLPLDIDGCAPQADAGESPHTVPLAQRLYSQEALADLPASVTNASLGCGNPLAIAHLQPGETVLDLGCGGGLDCFLAARAVGPTGSVIGVDMTENMVALANQHKATLGVTNVAFRYGQIEALPVESASVDSIISNCVIDIAPDKAAVFAEAFRVLKPGGRLSITDTVIQGEFPTAIKANIDRWAGAVITPLIPLEEYLGYIHRAGFVEVAVESLTSYGLENLAALDETSRHTLTHGVDWLEVPEHAGLYSARIVARKPAAA
jgi:arsenite methyltransferase